METKSIIGVIRAISSNNQKMNAKELAQLLNCSEKTIKNYINEINCDKITDLKADFDRNVGSEYKSKGAV